MKNGKRQWLYILVVMLACAIMQGCSAPHPANSLASGDQVEQQEPSPSPAAADNAELNSSIIDEQQDAVQPTDEQDSSSSDSLHGSEIDSAVPSSEDVASEPALPAKTYALPDGFVYLDDILEDAQYDIRYYGENNFVGRPIEGYLAPYAIATEEMAAALVKVSEEMQELGYGLLIYDTYRPAKAVEVFKEWSQDEADTLMKDSFYPNEEKSKLFQRGYLSQRSGHSRGSTVDLTLYELASGEPLDMGSPYDLLDEISYFGTRLITDEQAANRELLKKVMKKHGFKEYSKEWWHYVLLDEPYPSTYFDFDVQ
ncbi:M15 family metallopeptidase [Paenibacillus septentrionalis]|uniref:D-alanyl-D-alanine dipeptidase n=1 Tax=Paenibacillus septentrionalis TaxID=429342 RepID=A0ABW1V949_9BACL